MIISVWYRMFIIVSVFRTGVWYQVFMSVFVSAGPMVWYQMLMCVCVCVCRPHGVVPNV